MEKLNTLTKSNLHFDTSGNAWSYRTRIIQVLFDGRKIGNVTKYSVTTSRHQTQARVHDCDILVDDIPAGTDDLLFYTNLIG